MLVSVLMTFSLTMKATHAILHKYKKVLFFIQDKKIKYWLTAILQMLVSKQLWRLKCGILQK